MSPCCGSDLVLAVGRVVGANFCDGLCMGNSQVDQDQGREDCRQIVIEENYDCW